MLGIGVDLQGTTVIVVIWIRFKLLQLSTNESQHATIMLLLCVGSRGTL